MEVGKNILEICEISSSHGGEYEVQICTLKRRSTIILHGSTSQKTNLNFIILEVIEENSYNGLDMQRE
jgi:hypothetical protein